MRPWERAVAADVAALRNPANGALAFVDGDSNRIRRREREALVPSYEYVLLTDPEEEHEAEVDIQWSIFADKASELGAMESALERALTGGIDTFHMVGGEMMYVRRIAGRSIEDPAEGVFHRAIDYRHILAKGG